MTSSLSLFPAKSFPMCTFPLSKRPANPGYSRQAFAFVPIKTAVGFPDHSTLPPSLPSPVECHPTPLSTHFAVSTHPSIVHVHSPPFVDHFQVWLPSQPLWNALHPAT